MPRETFPHLQPGCPWYDLSEWRIPNVKWCEAQQCSIIVEPFNTWSNLAYIFISFLMAWAARGLRSRTLRLYAPCTFIVGATSFVYHMSYTFVLQVLDFVGMYVFCFLLIMINLMRLGQWSRRRPFTWYWGLVTAFTLLTVGADFIALPFQGFIFLLSLLIIATELRCRNVARATGKSYALPWFWTAVGCLGVAAFFSASDVTRFICDPDNHWFQGHGFWHVLTALALGAAFLHHRQFDDALTAYDPKN